MKATDNYKLQQTFLYNPDVIQMYKNIQSGLSEEIAKVDVETTIHSFRTLYKNPSLNIYTALSTWFPTLETTILQRWKKFTRTDIQECVMAAPIAFMTDQLASSYLLNLFLSSTSSITAIEGAELANRYRELGGKEKLVIINGKGVNTITLSIVTTDGRPVEFTMYNAPYSLYWSLLSDILVCTTGDPDIIETINKRNRVDVGMTVFAIPGAPGSRINQMIKNGAASFADRFSDFGLKISE